MRFLSNVLVRAVLVGGAAHALGAPIAYDGFDGGPRADLHGANGGFGWTGAWSDLGSSQITSVAAPGLTWPSLPSAMGAAHTPAGTLTFDAAIYQRNFTPPAQGPMYISFLMQPDANIGSYGGLAIGSYPAQVQFGIPLGYAEYGLRVGRYGFSVTTVPVQTGRTAFIVLEVVHATTTTTYNLYVNPRAQDPRPPYPACQFVRGGFTPPAAYVGILNDGGCITDEIRIATTWEEAMGRQHCVADVDDGTFTGTPDGGVTIDDLLYYLHIFELGAVAADVDDGTFTGVPDGGVTIDDLLYFLFRFESGC